MSSADFGVEFLAPKSCTRYNAEPRAQPHSDWIIETEWTDDIEEDPHVRRRLSSVVSIFRVPKFLKDTKKEAYVPQRVSLGPHHHGSEELSSMGHHKERALSRMMKRFNMDFADRAREEILKMEKEIRDSYEENIDCDGETLSRMLTLDGCFILEVLITMDRKTGQYYEPIFGRNKLQYAAYDILNDILMLENQVPLFVIRKLLNMVLNSAVEIEEMLLDVLVPMYHKLSPFKDGNFNIEQWSSPKQGLQVHHLLGFLHTAIVSPTFNEGERVDQGMKCCKCCSIFIKCCKCCNMCTGMLQDKNKAWDDIESIPRAVELRNAGIFFKRCNGGIKKIQFDPNSATIYLPLICITDYTEIAFRNLIAFEMCKPFKIKNYVSLYMNLMDDLIDSEEDVALLRRKGVLTNRLGSDQEVANLFNCLGKEVAVSMENEFNELTKKVNAHYNNKLKVRVGEFVRDHFSSSWGTLVLAAAIVILSIFNSKME